MFRRNFLQNTASALAGSIFSLNQMPMKNSQLDKIGIQLFSLPKYLDADFNAALTMLSEMGYRELELYGPFSFSADSAKNSWKAITSALGFSGSGLFGHTQQATVEILKKLDLTVPALHTDLVTLQLHLGDLSRMCHVLGIEYVGIAAIPMELRANLKAYETIAHTFNQIGENVRGEGLKFYYHNHGYGLQKQEGQIPLDIIFHETDPDLVFFEMDIYWMTAGGADPIEYLEKYGDRYRLMHLKDMKELRRFSGDGGDPGQWMELFPFMASAGEGVLDLEGIIDKALRVGVEHFFVEQDMVANPNVALKRSYDYLEKLSFS